jgi:fatty-acyl-CoA synthase
MLLGCTVVLRRRFDPELALQAVAAQRATSAPMVPVMLQRIMQLDPAVRRCYDTSGLRVIPLGGSAIPAGLAERAMDALGDVVYNVYGSTEAALATLATPADLRAAPGTAGRPLPGTRVRVLDGRDRELPAGQTGAVFVSSPLASEGYSGGGHKRSVGGLLSTGDLGHLDDHGRLFIDGREDEMIVSGGENVYPGEVEDLLVSHPAILEAAAVGVQDDDFGQRLRAFVVCQPGAALTAEQVRTHVKANLARYKVPRDVVMVPELPRNPAGKVLKRELVSVGRNGSA